MLCNVGRRCQGIVSWPLAVPTYDVFDVITPPYMTHYAFYTVLWRHIIDIILFPSPGHCVTFFSFSICFIGFASFCLWLTSSLPPVLLYPILRYSIAIAVFVVRHCRWRHFSCSKWSILGGYRVVIRFGWQGLCVGCLYLWSDEVPVLFHLNALCRIANSSIMLSFITEQCHFHSLVGVSLQR